MGLAMRTEKKCKSGKQTNLGTRIKAKRSKMDALRKHAFRRYESSIEKSGKIEQNGWTKI